MDDEQSVDSFLTAQTAFTLVRGERGVGDGQESLPGKSHVHVTSS
jgi:hypothetical protein